MQIVVFIDVKGFEPSSVSLKRNQKKKKKKRKKKKEKEREKKDEILIWISKRRKIGNYTF